VGRRRNARRAEQGQFASIARGCSSREACPASAASGTRGARPPPHLPQAARQTTG